VLTQLRSVGRIIALVVAAWTVVIGLVVAAHNWWSIPVAHLTRDPLAVLEAPVYIGTFSQAGIFVWVAAVTVCLFGALVLPTNATTRPMRLFLLAFGLVTLMLAVDDAFLFHEEIFPALGIPDKGVMLGHLLVVSLALVVFHRLIRTTDYVLLGLALLCFAASIGVDVLESEDSPVFLLEDGAKLAGILFWLAYFSRVAVAAVREHLTSRAPN